MFDHPSWRKHPFRTGLRLCTCLARRRVGAWSQVAVPYQKGLAKLWVDVRTRFGYTVYRYGHHDPDIDLLRRLLGPGDWMVDGGAHVGLFTLVAAACVGPSGKVLAFEPAPEARAQLLKNVEINGFSRVDVRSEALAEEQGTREFVAFSVEAWGSSSFAPPEGLAGGQRETVETVTLDSVISSEEQARLKLIKLDLEGAEYAALRGAQRLLAEAKPDLILELEPEHLARQGATIDAIVRLLEPYGYAFFRAEWNADDEVVLVPTDLKGSGGGHPNVYMTRDVRRAEQAGVAVMRRESSQEASE
jgi:FkbM family methyltransferase